METKPRPAYVQFEVRSVEDRTETLDKGRYISRDVIFAIITPAGTKDRIEKEATEWLKSVDEGIMQERIPAEWGEAYRAAYARYQTSQENPEFGTPIREWPQLSPSQVKNLLDCNLRSIEDLAEASEEAVMRIGMGGRALKEKAQAWLDAASGTGQVAAELETLRQRNAELEQRDAAREEELAKLQRRMEALEKPEPALAEED